MKNAKFPACCAQSGPQGESAWGSEEPRIRVSVLSVCPSVSVSAPQVLSGNPSPYKQSSLASPENEADSWVRGVDKDPTEHK